MGVGEVEVVERITGGDVVVALVMDGDHRLSRAPDIARLERTVAEVTEALRAAGGIDLSVFPFLVIVRSGVPSS